MSIRSVYREGHSASRLAWALIPLALVVGALILLRQPANDATAQVTVVETWPDAEMLSVNPTREQANSTQGFVPPTAERRDQVLQRLSQFRADYKQLAPSMSVSFRPGSSERGQLAETIAQALSQYGLGSKASGVVPDTTVKNRSAPIVMRAARAHRETVHRLLEALAPYFSAQVLLVFDDDTRIDALTFHISGTPAFNEDGLAIFGR
ncbi:hypothetical protein CWI75_10845 [Kineobactrum sediminis]|uniref:Uncharacterized protein n=1 Tax=Kineobactrum sediminis TaxID=1905677 RepID=A0A2N5Y1K2_9GAMM|nr:hypothetical protein [Kineobactrum sediminis]PLW82266.1 hypothetical protein CWI75_10845 [Kineobactrum sediminis]